MSKSVSNAAEIPWKSDLSEALSDEVVGLVAQAHEQDYLDAAQVAAFVRDAELTPGEAEDLLMMLTDLGIDVIERRRCGGAGGGRGRGRGGQRRGCRSERGGRGARPGARLPVADRSGGVAVGSPGGRSGQAHRAARHGRQARHDRGQPASRGEHRQTLRRPRPALARPHPGGQPGAHPRCREVRLSARLQVLHPRPLVDPPGHRSRPVRQGAHDPPAGARRRGAEQLFGAQRRLEQRAAASRRPRRSPRRWASARTGCARSSARVACR